MKRTILLSLSAALGLLACRSGPSDGGGAPKPAGDGAPSGAASAPASAPTAAVGGPKDYAPLPAVPDGHEVAIFAGGCFWCMEKPFDVVDGVIATTSGYIGGKEERPSYRQVSSGTTGHTEAVHVVFDPKRVSYERLLEVFWHNIDPTMLNRQFCDGGTQYRTGIYPVSPAQTAAAEASRAALTAAASLPGPIVTEITGAGPFWTAENYHQDYYVKNPAHYTRYRTGCGRDRRLAELWGEKAGH